MLSTLMSDLRYALRGLAARPLFLLVAVASLALGIGVTTAIFSLYEQVALRPLPVRAPERLVNLAAPGPKSGSTSSNGMGARDEVFSYPMFADLSRTLPAQFVGLAGQRHESGSLRWQGHTRVVSIGEVSGNYFDLLGLAPQVGRLLAANDDRAAAHVVVLTERFWQRELAGADVLGKTVEIKGRSFEVVGIAPAGFAGISFGNDVDLFLPLSLRPLLTGDPDEREDRRSFWLYLFARLASGVSPAAAEAALNVPYQRLLSEVELPLYGALDDAERKAFVAKRITLADGARGQSRNDDTLVQPLQMLLALAALVLLIACLNIANLLLARGSARAAEFAVRASIGASRGRLVRQLLLEAVLLATLGAVLALPLASLVSSALAGWMPVASQAGLAFAPNAPVLAFALALTGATVLLFGLFPAWQLARTAPVTVLRGEGGQTSSRAGNRFRTALATAQIGFSLASLVLAGLFAKSLLNIAAQPLGMQVDDLLMFTLPADQVGYSRERAGALFERVEQRLASLPGVSAVTSSSVPLLADSEWGTNVSVEGYDNPKEEIYPDFSLVGADFVGTLGMQLRAGRDFRPSDRDGTDKVAIVNEDFVEHFHLGPNPIGKRIGSGSEPTEVEIVGVVGNSRYHNVKIAPPPLFFLPWRQRTAGAMTFYVRSALPAGTLLPQIGPLIAEIDPDLPVDGLQTVQAQINDTLAMERFVGLLSTAFAVLSTLLAALGLYGVLAYTLSQRMREFGLRLALGAAPARMRRLVFGQVGRMTAIGAVLGLGAALAVGRAAESLLFGLDGHDPLVLMSATAVLLLVAALSALMPAQRAARVEPMVALRHD